MGWLAFRKVKDGFHGIQVFLALQTGSIATDILRTITEVHRPKITEEVKRKYPDTSELIKKGEIKQAISILEERVQEDPAVKEQLAEVLLVSKDVEDWDKARNILLDYLKSTEEAPG